MILITLSTFLSVIVINLYFRGDKKNRVPKWLKRVSFFSSPFAVQTSKHFNSDTTNNKIRLKETLLSTWVVQITCIMIWGPIRLLPCRKYQWNVNLFMEAPRLSGMLFRKELPSLLVFYIVSLAASLSTKKSSKVPWPMDIFLTSCIPPFRSFKWLSRSN